MTRRSIYLWFGPRVLLVVLVSLLWQTTAHWTYQHSLPLVFSPLVANAQSKNTIHPGDVVKRSLEGGGTQTYVLDLEKGNYAHLTLEQRAIESDLALSDPNGQTILRVNSRHRELTPVSFIAKASGS